MRPRPCRSRFTALAALGCALSLYACTTLVERSQVAVAIDAAPGLRARIDHVDVEVRSGSPAGGSADWETRLSSRLSPKPGDQAWPLRFLLVRRQDEARNGYLVIATARDAVDGELGQVRARSEYAPGRTLELQLQFDQACADRGALCADGLSCRDGECVDPFVDVHSLPPVDPAQILSSPEAGPEPQAGGAAQSCDAGGECPAASSCGADNGGCDPLARCLEQAGKAECAPCPPGFLGNGVAGCLPALRELSAVAGTLKPAFSPDHTEYVLELPLPADRATLQLTAASGATLDVDGSAVASGTSWSGPAPAFGDKRLVAIAVAASGHPSRIYNLELRRVARGSGYLKASNPSNDDEFGRTVAVWGDTLVVGAPFEDSSARSGAPDESLKDSGAAYVFARDAAGAWRQQAYLKADTPIDGAHFGLVVAIERERLLIAAVDESNKGAVYMFERDATGDWKSVAALRPDDAGGSAPKFGCALAMDGDRVVVGASGDDVGATESGAIYVFDRGPGGWAQSARFKTKTPNSLAWLGSSIGLSGDLIASGATGETVDGLPSGIVYVFAANGGNWEQVATLTPSPVVAGGFFGEGLAMSGNTIAASAFNGTAGLTDGVVYVYVREANGGFRQEAVLRASNATGNDLFGVRMALAGDALLIGAPQESSAAGGVGADASGTLEKSGAAYLFNRAGGVWREVVRLKAAQPGAQDRFGTSVAMNGDTIVVGANGDASSGNGIEPSPTPRTAASSGAAHVFR